MQKPGQYCQHWLTHWELNKMTFCRKYFQMQFHQWKLLGKSAVKLSFIRKCGYYFKVFLHKVDVPQTAIIPIIVLWFKFHLIWFLGVQLTMNHHCLRWTCCLCAVWCQAITWTTDDPVHWCIYLSPGGRFNIKMPSYQYRKSHCGDKTVVRSSYLHNGISYTGKMTSLYWFRPLVSMS